MQLKQLEAFVRVAELGGFSKAALVLGSAQSALSRSVRQLETDLRVALLERTGRGVVLTEAGKRLYEHGLGILQLVARAEEAVEASRAERSGRVVVGLPPSLSREVTLPLVESFARDCPRAHLAIVEGLSAHVTEWLATGRVDVALVYNPEPHAAIETEPLRHEPLLLVSPPPAGARGAKARAAALVPVTLAELPDWPLVIPERSHAIRRRLEADAALAGIKLTIAWEVSSVPAILDLVRAGHGHAVLTAAAVAADTRAGTLVARPLGEPPLFNTLSISRPANRRATPLMHYVVRRLRELVHAP